MAKATNKENIRSKQIDQQTFKINQSFLPEALCLP
jgi:hypothetical protein